MPRQVMTAVFASWASAAPVESLLAQASRLCTDWREGGYISLCAAAIQVCGSDLRIEQGIESLVDGAVPPDCDFEPLVEVAPYPGLAVVAERAVLVFVLEEELACGRVRERGQVERLLESRRRRVRGVVRGRVDCIAPSSLVSTGTALSLPRRFSHRRVVRVEGEESLPFSLSTHAQNQLTREGVLQKEQGASMPKAEPDKIPVSLLARSRPLATVHSTRDNNTAHRSRPWATCAERETPSRPSSPSTRPKTRGKRSTAR